VRWPDLRAQGAALDSAASQGQAPGAQEPTPEQAPNEVCRNELLRQALYPDSIEILASSPSGAPAGTTGLVYLFSGKNRFGWDSRWRSHCQVTAEGELLRFRTVLVPQ